jgi:methionyl-tRNA formyltransferase
MHPTRFDHGVVLSQTPAPGIPIPEDCTSKDLIEILGPVGAELLCQGIEDGLFVDLKGARAEPLESDKLEHAPKITPEDRHIDWATWNADEILLRDRVLGRLWDLETYAHCFDSGPKRVAFEGPWTKEDVAIASVTALGSAAPGQLVLLRTEESRIPKLGFQTCDHQIIVPLAATIDGEKKGTGIAAIVNHLSR